MAIFLDANVLYSWRTFAELDRVALTIVSQQIQQRIVVPDIAAWEGEAHYRRKLQRARSGLVKAHHEAGDAFRGEEIPPLAPLDIEAAVDRWRDGLVGFATIERLHPDDVSQAFRREAFGDAPAKRVLDEKGLDVGGKGGRDAAIWLTVLRRHNARAEEGHFISKNTTDFGRTAELKSALAKELDPTKPPLNFYSALEDFLVFLGTQERDSDIALDEVARRVPLVLRRILPMTADIPREIFGAEFDWARYDYVTEIKDARPTKVLAVRRYEQGDQAITIVNADWDLVVDCFRRLANDEIGPVAAFVDVRMVGSIQFYLPDDENLSAQVVSTRLRAPSLPPVVTGVGG